MSSALIDLDNIEAELHKDDWTSPYYEGNQYDEIDINQLLSDIIDKYIDKDTRVNSDKINEIMGIFCEHYRGTAVLSQLDKMTKEEARKLVESIIC